MAFQRVGVVPEEDLVGHNLAYSSAVPVYLLYRVFPLAETVPKDESSGFPPVV